MSNVEAALNYCKRGLSIIPIKPKDKKPLIAWEEFQTRRADEDEIKSWFDKWQDANIGTVTGQISGTIVIDIDSDEAKDRLKQKAGDYDLDTVPRTRTGRGWQLMFKHPGEKIQNRAGILPGLDVRGDGGYVVLPPSVHANGKNYKWEVPLNGELPKLPQQLFSLITSGNGTGQEPRERFNTAQALAGKPLGERDETVFKLACTLRQANVPQDFAERLILESASNCDPPFSERIALEKVTRAYTQYEPKKVTPNQGKFWPELISAKDLLALPPDPTRWLWDKCLPVGGCSILVSKPKVGKSTFAANLSLAVCRGQQFLGRETQQSPVAYLSLDASLPEMAETFTSLGMKDSDLIFLHAGGAPEDTVAWLMQRISEKGVRLVVIDTLQRLFKFRDVNDYSLVTNSMEPLLDQARQQNIHVLFTHHAKKDSGDDLDSAIGSTAIRGLAYTYLHLKRLPESDRRIFRSDQRGGKNFGETAIGFDRDGLLTVQGTREAVEIDEIKPKIREFIEAAEGDPTEREITNTVGGRAIIISKALRQMFKNDELGRTGKGRKGSPFRYSLSPTIEMANPNSLPGIGVIGGRELGREMGRQTEEVETTEEMLFPENREENGKRMEENPKRVKVGRETSGGITVDDILREFPDARVVA